MIRQSNRGPNGRISRCNSNLLAVLMFALFLSGCIVVPMRAPTAIKDASGVNTPLPPEPPVIGKTTRAQIEAQYKSFAVDSGVPNFFWGRFRKSTWVVVAGMYGGGGAAGRTWGSYNLLATLDNAGALRTFETVPDSELLTRLVAMRKQG